MCGDLTSTPLPFCLLLAQSFRNQTDALPVILNLVTKGITVLAYDPTSQGERMQYVNPATGESDIHECEFLPSSPSCYNQGSSCTLAHSYYARQLFLVDATLAAIWLWDAIRSIDLLESFDFIDNKRLGVAGCSGTY